MYYLIKNLIIGFYVTLMLLWMLLQFILKLLIIFLKFIWIFELDFKKLKYISVIKMETIFCLVFAPNKVSFETKKYKFKEYFKP